MTQGWQADPSGKHTHRYHDGNNWTEFVSDNGVQSTDPYDPSAPAVPAPPQYAPPQQASPQYAPPQQAVPAYAPPKKRRRVWPWVVLGLIVLFLGGCGVFVVAVNNAVDELNTEQASHAITQEQFDAVPLGITHAEVETMLGKPPENAQEFNSKSVNFEINSSCIYYNRVGETFGSAFQFCFDNDSLRSKNSY